MDVFLSQGDPARDSPFRTLQCACGPLLPRRKVEPGTTSRTLCRNPGSQLRASDASSDRACSSGCGNKGRSMPRPCSRAETGHAALPLQERHSSHPGSPLAGNGYRHRTHTRVPLPIGSRNFGGTKAAFPIQGHVCLWHKRRFAPSCGVSFLRHHPPSPVSASNHSRSSTRGQGFAG